METVSTDKAPKPSGHYSQGVVHNGLVYVAGQLPIDPETGERVLSSPEAQVERVLQNVEAVLLAAGSGLEHVLKVTVYVSETSLWGAVNAVYADAFGDHKPARAIVPVKEFRDGMQVEMEVIAAIP